MARTRVATYNIMFTANSDQIRKSFSNLQNMSKTWATQFTTNLTNVAFAWNQIASAAAPVINRFREMTAELDILAKTSRRLGIAPEFLQALEVAGGRLGVSMSQIDRSLTAFQRRVGLMRRGDQSMTDAFAEIGLSAANMSSQMETAFMQARDALAAVDDETRRASLAAELFGRSGSEMLALFSDNAGIREAAQHLKEIGGAVTEKELEAIEAFNDAWDDLSRRFEVIYQQFVIKITPSLLELIGVLERAVDGIQAINRLAENNAVLRFVLQGTFPGSSLFGSSGGGAVSQASPGIAVDRVGRRVQREQSATLKSIDRKLDRSVVMAQGGIN